MASTSLLPGAQPPADPRDRLVGNWHMRYDDASGANLRGGFVSINKAREGNGIVLFGHFIDRAGKQTAINGAERLTFTGDTLKGSFYPYRETMQVNLVLTADGNTLQGDWRYPAKDSDRQAQREEQREGRTYAIGKETWTRQVPVVTGVDLRLAYAVGSEGTRVLDHARIAERYRSARERGNMPRLHIELHGEDLPVERYAIRQISCSDPELSRANPVAADRGLGPMVMVVYLTDKVKPGRKTFTLNGTSFDVDLEFDNYLDPDSPRELRFLRRIGERLEPALELHPGDEFVVEAHYAAKPPSPPATMQLAWPGSGAQSVALKPTKDARVFRSGPLLVSSPVVAP